MDDASQKDPAAAAGSSPEDLPEGSAAADLVEQIGAEIDRRLDARLAALGLTRPANPASSPALPADAAPGATHEPGRGADAAPEAALPPRQREGAILSRWQTLWIGIMIGSAVSGGAAIVQGVRISTHINQVVGGPLTFVNASWTIAEALVGAWVVLFVIWLVQLGVDDVRGRR